MLYLNERKINLKISKIPYLFCYSSFHTMKFRTANIMYKIENLAL